VENILAKSRYLVGNTFTEADLRLFMTLIRFDAVYIVYFKCDKRAISSYHHIQNYCRDIYQMPSVKATINLDHIKKHYFTSHPLLNAYSVIPTGPDVESEMLKKHDRDRFCVPTP
jgi:glutathionyl-hydroquinone reductase